ncbi:MAG: sugar ABC transporter permease [Thermobacillus sp.]|jgi:multiple sugar transport system permease protein|uniref:carbohydrate ABC transporter permease n=1 Tax=Thermobacillus sp. TaxID=2108467 RepID=UPI000E398D1F|nr:carbohydrate ABC transporter permease [Thermobacillus sp.]REK55989.1 MAG: sugar ABC transporter permease [Thermobacillus sp.]
MSRVYAANKGASVIKTVIAVIASAVMLYPLLWMLASSFKPQHLIFQDLSLWPDVFTLENYINGWNGFTNLTFGTFFKNSFIVVLFCIIGNLLTCSMAAYAFARLEFTARNFWFALMFGSLLLPHHVVLIPQYILFDSLDWINTYMPLIVPKFLASDAFFIFLMVQFIRGLPLELDQAAKVDGCGHIQIYGRIIVPLLLPAIVTTSIFTLIWTWNDFFSQLIYISDPRKLTVALALRSFMDTMGQSSMGSLFAMSILSLVPIFIFFLVFQRWLIEGIATYGVKG